MVRVTATAARGLAVDLSSSLGRGAYLCPSQACLEQACRRRAFPRALRQELPGLNLAEVGEEFEAALRRRGALVIEGRAANPEGGPDGVRDLKSRALDGAITPRCGRT